MTTPETDPHRPKREAVWRAIEGKAVTGQVSVLALYIAGWPSMYKGHDHLAESIGSSRESVVKMLRKLKATGLLVELGKKKWKDGQQTIEYIINQDFKGCPSDTSSRGVETSVKGCPSVRQDVSDGPSRGVETSVKGCPSDTQSYISNNHSTSSSSSSMAREDAAPDDDDDDDGVSFEDSERRETTKTTRTIDVEPDPKAVYEDHYRRQAAAAAVAVVEPDRVKTEDPDPIPLTVSTVDPKLDSSPPPTMGQSLKHRGLA